MLHACFIGGNCFVQPGVVHRDSDMPCQRVDQFLVLFGKGAELGAFQIQYTDEAVAHNERHNEFGPDLDLGVPVTDVALVFEHVVDADRPAQERAGARQTPPERKSALERDMLAKTQRVIEIEQLCALVPQHHTEQVVVHKPAHAFGDFGVNLVELQAGV